MSESGRRRDLQNIGTDEITKVTDVTKKVYMALAIALSNDRVTYIPTKKS